MGEDMLQEISYQDLSLLSELYKHHEDKAPHIYSSINTAILWKKRKPNSNYLTVYGVNDDWLKTGTIIIVMQYHCRDILFYTLEDDCRALYEALTQTRKINWSETSFWYAILNRHIPMLTEVLKTVEQEKPTPKYIETGLWAIEKEKAIKFEIICPDDVYIAQLNNSHIGIITSYWPHSYEGAEERTGIFLEMNPAYGVFLKSDDSLVTWVLRSHMGQMAMLQTVPEHTRKGYAMLITKFMSKKIALGGHNPLGTVLTNNKASQRMFERLGFKCIDMCSYT